MTHTIEIQGIRHAVPKPVADLLQNVSEERDEMKGLLAKQVQMFTLMELKCSYMADELTKYLADAGGALEGMEIV